MVYICHSSQVSCWIHSIHGNSLAEVDFKMLVINLACMLLSTKAVYHVVWNDSFLVDCIIREMITGSSRKWRSTPRSTGFKKFLYGWEILKNADGVFNMSVEHYIRSMIQSLVHTWERKERVRTATDTGHLKLVENLAHKMKYLHAFLRSCMFISTCARSNVTSTVLIHKTDT